MKAAPKNDDPTRFLPVGVHKSYFLLFKADRDVLNIALGKYQPAESEPILVGGARLLKSALRLLTLYRLRIDEIRDGKAVTIYTRWLEAVQVKDESVSVTLNPSFKRIWLEVKSALLIRRNKRQVRDFEANTRSGFSVGQKSTSEPCVFQLTRLEMFLR